MFCFNCGAFEGHDFEGRLSDNGLCPDCQQKPTVSYQYDPQTGLHRTRFMNERQRARFYRENRSITNEQG